MVSMAKQPDGGLIYNLRLSSVGPGQVTGQDEVYEPTNVDLAMKLHYLRAVYYYEREAFDGLGVLKIKEPLFTLLNHYYVVCGRFRRTESGRPFLKCNDCGVRFIEASCDKSLEEWIEMKDAGLERLLSPNGVIGPEIFFSPPVWLQLTKFRCGGVSLGLSWSHILGDAFSAAKFMNMFGKVISGIEPEWLIRSAQLMTKDLTHQDVAKKAKDPLSIKKVSPVGDHWKITNNCEMVPFTFSITPSQMGRIRSIIGNYGPFELISSIIWRSVARNRIGPEPRVVTICKKGPQARKNSYVSNDQQICTVKAADSSSVREADLPELAKLLKHEATDKLREIDEAVARDGGNSDFVLYGANLTLVDMDYGEFYELDWRGHKPVYVSYQIDGVGDEGCVVVLPGPGDGAEGRVVTVVLPENEVTALKSELRKEWSIA
ncbi:unnamed protein product [Cuscuta epithymum]|uniref:Protein ECERIFERUM 26-like n=1 Tax=Cuscuta epithymum TaxID=186058 RepID=A0AAV0G300_9ASTE|nr:unnamed protein product [Cuscuta epithymum]